MKAKRTLAFILALTLALSLMSVSAFASGETALTSAGGTLESGSYILNENVNLTADIVTSDNAEVTLDLNGYTLTGTGNDSVIRIGKNGTFTLKDSSTSQTGTVTGGNGTEIANFHCGGGILSEGSFTMEGGIITGNSAEQGGGVFICKDRSFTMKGGQITGNSADVGGGVYLVTSSATLTMTGGTISNNTAKGTAGGISSGTLTLLGGTIAGNKANEYGGIQLVEAVTLGGDVSIFGNTANGTTPSNLIIRNNEYVQSKIVFSTETVPTDKINVWVTGSGVISDASDADYSSQFHSDSKAYTVKYNADKQLELVELPSVTFTAGSASINEKTAATTEIGTVAVKLFPGEADVTYTVASDESTISGTVTDGKLSITTTAETLAGNYTVTVTATEGEGANATTAEVKVPVTVGTFLDLEDEDATYPDSMAIPQNYDVTTTSAGYEDVTKVRLTWTTEDITASVSGNKVWNPDKLAWVDSADSTATITNTDGSVTAQFNLENLSSVEVNATVTFAVAKDGEEDKFTAPTVAFKDNDEAKAGDGKVRLGTVVGSDENRSVNTANPHTGKVAVTLSGFVADEFKGLNKGVFGNYTVTLSEFKAPVPVPLKFSFVSAFTNPPTITANSLMYTEGSTWAELIAANKGKTITMSDGTAEKEYTLTTSNQYVALVSSGSKYCIVSEEIEGKNTALDYYNAGKVQSGTDNALGTVYLSSWS